MSVLNVSVAATGEAGLARSGAAGAQDGRDGPRPLSARLHDHGTHLQTLVFFTLGVDQNYYNFTNKDRSVK